MNKNNYYKTIILLILSNLLILCQGGEDYDNKSKDYDTSSNETDSTADFTEENSAKYSDIDQTINTSETSILNKNKQGILTQPSISNKNYNNSIVNHTSTEKDKTNLNHEENNDSDVTANITQPSENSETNSSLINKQEKRSDKTDEDPIQETETSKKNNTNLILFENPVKLETKMNQTQLNTTQNNDEILLAEEIRVNTSEKPNENIDNPMNSEIVRNPKLKSNNNASINHEFSSGINKLKTFSPETDDDKHIIKDDKKRQNSPVIDDRLKNSNKELEQSKLDLKIDNNDTMINNVSESYVNITTTKSIETPPENLENPENSEIKQITVLKSNNDTINDHIISSINNKTSSGLNKSTDFSDKPVVNGKSSIKGDKEPLNSTVNDDLLKNSSEQLEQITKLSSKIDNENRIHSNVSESPVNIPSMKTIIENTKEKNIKVDSLKNQSVSNSLKVLSSEKSPKKIHNNINIVNKDSESPVSNERKVLFTEKIDIPRKEILPSKTFAKPLPTLPTKNSLNIIELTTVIPQSLFNDAVSKSEKGTQRSPKNVDSLMNPSEHDEEILIYDSNIDNSKIFNVSKSSVNITKTNSTDNNTEDEIKIIENLENELDDLKNKITLLKIYVKHKSVIPENNNPDDKYPSPTTIDVSKNLHPNNSSKNLNTAQSKSYNKSTVHGNDHSRKTRKYQHHNSPKYDSMINNDHNIEAETKDFSLVTENPQFDSGKDLQAVSSGSNITENLLTAERTTIGTSPNTISTERNIIIESYEGGAKYRDTKFELPEDFFDDNSYN